MVSSEVTKQVTKWKKAGAAISIGLLALGVGAVVYNYSHIPNGNHSSTSTSSTTSTVLKTPFEKLSSQNATLAKEVQRNVQTDPHVTGNKTTLTNLASQLFLDTGTYSANEAVIHTAGNLTNYEQKNPDTVFGQGNMSKLIGDLETNPNLVSGFKSASTYDSFAKLLIYVPDIENNPLIWKNAAIQVDNIVHGYNLDQKYGDAYIYAKAVGPTVQFILDLQKKGIINLNNLGISNQSLVDQSIQQIVLPKQITNQNITDGSSPIVDSTPNIGMWIYNVTPNHFLNGSSPQGWLEQQTWKDYLAKGFIYNESMRDLLNKPGTPGTWPNSYSAYLKILGNVTKYNDKISFTLGYPTGLRYEFSRFANNMPGQLEPYYSVLVGRNLGVPVFIESAHYPTGPDTHDEPVAIVSDSLNNQLIQYGDAILQNHFGFWLYKQPFLQDYQNSQTKAQLEELGSTGKCVLSRNEYTPS